MKKGIAALAISLGLLTGSCLGVESAPEQSSFPAMHALKDWNNTATQSRWLNQGLFMVCNVVPIYLVAGLLDLVIFNSVEFWNHED